MTIEIAVFEFKFNWRVTFKRKRFKKFHGRKYTVWEIKIYKNAALKGTHKYVAFTPSASISRYLIRKYYK